ncbi:MAG: group III truncated hemoglobin [Acidobacteriaceae bacterium]
MPATFDEMQISQLVDRFYSRARKDELLGPIFSDAVGDNWDLHLAKMKDFWSSIMLASRKYKGNPMLAHVLLPRLSPIHFERWLAIWRDTAAEVCSGASGAMYVQKAEFMAERLLSAIELHHAC